MAPPRKKPLPPGVAPTRRKPSVSSTGGVQKHSSSRSASKSSAAATAAATALAAGSSASASRPKPKPKAPRHVPDQSTLPSFERMDNGMRFSSFPVVFNINQKNYYTDYLKKDEQVEPY
jgi:hypothetical protein